MQTTLAAVAVAAPAAGVARRQMATPANPEKASPAKTSLAWSAPPGVTALQKMATQARFLCVVPTEPATLLAAEAACQKLAVWTNLVRAMPHAPLWPGWQHLELRIRIWMAESIGSSLAAKA